MVVPKDECATSAKTSEEVAQHSPQVLGETTITKSILATVGRKNLGKFDAYVTFTRDSYPEIGSLAVIEGPLIIRVSETEHQPAKQRSFVLLLH